jgi:branched-chain amino acid transport system substrate-binding protein
VARPLIIAAALAATIAGCGGGDGSGSPTHAEGDVLSVYVSVPRHGPTATAGAAALQGARAALKDAGGRGGDTKVRIVPIPTTRAGDDRWDPGTVEAGADRAADDPSTIGYIGEVEQGASALSLPVTNRKNILQVSPSDSLASLTRRPPAKPRAGPERYYPEGRRSFLRLVPNDLEVAGAMLALTAPADRIAVVSGPGIGARELVSTYAKLLAGKHREPVEETSLRGNEGAIADAVEELGRVAPDVIVLTGSAERPSLTFLAGLARRLPGIPVVTDGGLATVAPRPAVPAGTRTVSPILPAAAQPPGGRALLRAMGDPDGHQVLSEALYGYAAMETVLDAVRAGGSHRDAVRRAARAAGPRRTALGTLDVRRSGDAGRKSLAVMGLDGGRPTLERTLP